MLRWREREREMMFVLTMTIPHWQKIAQDDADTIEFMMIYHCVVFLISWYMVSCYRMILLDWSLVPACSNVLEVNVLMRTLRIGSHPRWTSILKGLKGVVWFQIIQLMIYDLVVWQLHHHNGILQSGNSAVNFCQKLSPGIHIKHK